jgi:hypothetical protein
MSTTAPDDLDIPVAVAYPSQRQTAKLLGIKESRLSRANGEAIKLPGGVRFPPRVVLELGAAFRQRSLNEVAGDLLEHVHQHAPDYEEHVRSEIDEFFANRSTGPLDPDRFLEEARRTLPRRLFEQVRRAYEAGEGSKQVALASTDRGPAARPVR